MNTILFLLWFFTPGGLANVAPIIAAKLPLLNKFNSPVDNHAKFRGKRLLGDHKTIRGFLSGILIGILIAYLQIFIYEHWAFVRSISPIKYTSVNPLLLGFLESFGALFGDAVKSFFKRQIGITSGKTWFPFDQIDYIIGGILFTSLYIRLTPWQYPIFFIVWFLMHPFSTFIGWLLKLKDSPI